jgi:hypothetical protein
MRWSVLLLTAVSLFSGGLQQRFASLPTSTATCSRGACAPLWRVPTLLAAFLRKCEVGCEVSPGRPAAVWHGHLGADCVCWTQGVGRPYVLPPGDDGYRPQCMVDPSVVQGGISVTLADADVSCTFWRAHAFIPSTPADVACVGAECVPQVCEWRLRGCLPREAPGVTPGWALPSVSTSRCAPGQHQPGSREHFPCSGAAPWGMRWRGCWLCLCAMLHVGYRRGFCLQAAVGSQCWWCCCCTSQHMACRR